MTPVAYHPAIETIEPDEAETQRALMETLRSIQEVTFKDYGHAVRSVHAKSHALLQGELRVLDGLPAALAQGLFAQTGTYSAIMRISTTPGDILDDAVSAPRGLGLKVVGVPGAQLAGDDATQDFVMAASPAFGAATPKKFLGNLKLLAKTTDAVPGLKKALSAVLRGVEAGLEGVGYKSPTVIALGGQRLTHPLGEVFFTQAPLRYGDYIAKLRVAPLSPNLVALKDSAISLDGRPNALRDIINVFFAHQGGSWEVAAQLCTDLETMPIEDASVVWPEDASPYVPVAEITIKPQTAWNDARAQVVDDRLAFSPWHCLAAHQPLGGVMRARRPAYDMSADFRAVHNGCPIHEPRMPVGSLPV